MRVLAWRGGTGKALGLGPRRGPLCQASSGPVLPRWPEPRPGQQVLPGPVGAPRPCWPAVPFLSLSRSVLPDVSPGLWLFSPRGAVLGQAQFCARHRACSTGGALLGAALRGHWELPGGVSPFEAPLPPLSCRRGRSPCAFSPLQAPRGLSRVMAAPWRLPGSLNVSPGSAQSAGTSSLRCGWAPLFHSVAAVPGWVPPTLTQHTCLAQTRLTL